jgi:transcriptional regulator with PAS, ATPase and Fis domain
MKIKNGPPIRTIYSEAAEQLAKGSDTRQKYFKAINDIAEKINKCPNLTLKMAEIEVIEACHRLTNNASKTARDLGIGRSTLYRKIPSINKNASESPHSSATARKFEIAASTTALGKIAQKANISLLDIENDIVKAAFANNTGMGAAVTLTTQQLDISKTKLYRVLATNGNSFGFVKR